MLNRPIYQSRINWKNCFLVIILTLFYGCQNDISKYESINIENILIDSMHKVKLYKLYGHNVAVEYSTFDQVIKVGILDTAFQNEYFKYNPHVGLHLFIYHCASCHYAYPDFKESIKADSVPSNSNSLKRILCSEDHKKIAKMTCEPLNDFELLVLVKYINGELW